MNTDQTVQVTGNQLPAYLLGRHRSVYAQAYARKVRSDLAQPDPQPMASLVGTPERIADDEELLLGITG